MFFGFVGDSGGFWSVYGFNEESVGLEIFHLSNLCNFVGDLEGDLEGDFGGESLKIEGVGWFFGK